MDRPVVVQVHHPLLVAVAADREVVVQGVPGAVAAAVAVLLPVVVHQPDVNQGKTCLFDFY